MLFLPKFEGKMELKHGYIQNTENIPDSCTGAGWIYFSEDDKSIYLDSGEGPVRFSGSDTDLSNYYTIEQVNAKIPSLDGYATESFVAEQLENLEIPEFSGDTATDKDITIVGVNVGNLKDGDVIPEGTTLTNLLEKMLRKTIGVKTVKPTVSLTSASFNNIYEVGTLLDLEFNYTYVDGKFVGESGYNYSINAGCEIESVSYFKNNDLITSTQDRLSIVEGDTSYKISLKYSDSTTTPLNNIGENANVTISSETISDIKNVTGAYKYFMGYSSNTSYEQFNSDDIRGLNTKSDFIKGDTIVVDSTIKSNGSSIVIACPNIYSLKSAENGLGASILSNFESGEVIVKTGEIETLYNVYVYPITNGVEIEFKNIIIG